MTPDEFKVRFDSVARRLRIARRELRDLSRHIADGIDAQAVYEMATDLVQSESVS